MFRFLHHNAPLFRKVQPILQDMAASKLSPKALLQSLDHFRKLTYVQRSYPRTNDSSLSVLAHFQAKLCPIYAKVAAFILSHKPHDVPLFYSGQPASHTFKKADILLIMCLMATFLVPPQEYEATKKHQAKFTHIKHFGYIFSTQNFKTIGILEYLKQELAQARKTQMTLRRIVTHQSPKQLIQKLGSSKLRSCKMNGNKDDIENHYGSLKTDFANKYIGGGSLTHGAVQQQIMFAVHPQMYTSMLLCEKMDENEALVFMGYEKYFQSQGYGHNVRLVGRNQHKYDLDMDGRAVEYITAIDAINFNRSKIPQFSMDSINREILKAYTGFNVEEISTVTTGNWGCGVFGGDLQLKIIIQWLAASLAGKDIVYCPFGKSSAFAPQKCMELISMMRVGEVYGVLEKAIEKMKKREKGKNYPLLEQIMSLIKTK